MVIPEPAPSLSCSRCDAAARDAGVERARRAAVERQVDHAVQRNGLREAVLGAALLAAPQAKNDSRLADLQAGLEATQARLDAAHDRLEALQIESRARAEADARALEAATRAHEAARSALDHIQKTWWYRLFHRRVGRR